MDCFLLLCVGAYVLSPCIFAVPKGRATTGRPYKKGWNRCMEIVCGVKSTHKIKVKSVHRNRVWDGINARNHGEIGA